MSRIIQVRGLSDDTYRALRLRAAGEGRSLSDVVREELDRAAARPTRRELWKRAAARGRPALSEPLAETVRRMRDRP